VPRNEATSAQLAAQLAKLTRLRWLQLTDSPGVDDHVLAAVANMSDLRVLDVSDTAVTDAGLAHLAALPLETLELRVARAVTARGLEHLRSIATLRVLTLTGIAIGDATEPLTALTNLRALKLYSTGVTDRGLAKLATLTNLRYLDLRDTAITDAGVAHVARLTQLRHLKIGSTALTDARVANRGARIRVRAACA
jgi:Ran GTPase-activating protein (RanGAP) involved in mRNA processing and transport